MSTFADLLLEFGEPPQGPVQHRAPVEEPARQTPEWRLSVSRAARGALTATCLGDWQAWTAGEILSYRDQPGDTSACVSAFLRDLCAGCAQPETLAGRFLLLAWSEGARSWHLWTDRTGSVQAYVAGNGKCFAIGTFSGAVYGYSRRRLDWEGLTGFFSLGFFPQDRTYYDDVRLLRPGSHYQFSSRGQQVRCEQYWSWRHEPCNGRSEADTIAEFGHTLARVLDRATRGGRIALPLSGGLDSRTVAACLPPDRAVVTYSYGYGEASVEPQIARQVAAAVGLPFSAHTIRPYLFDKLPLVLDAVEGFQDLTQTRQADMAEWLAEHADFVLGAHWGDVLCGDMGIASDASGDAQLEHLLKKMQKRGSDWLVSHLCAPNLGGADPREIVRESLRQEWERFSHIADADFRIKAVKTAQWAFRWTLPSVRMYQAGALPRLPFLDPAMIDFFCTVPTSLVRGRRIQIEYLKRHAPALARVRWQAFDADLFHYQHFHTWQVPRRALGRLKRMFNPPAFKRNWEVQFLGPRQSARLEAHLRAKNSLLAELLPGAAVSQLLAEFNAKPDAANGYTVSMLLTLAAWAARFHH